MKSTIIAIDGPSGTGKGTIASHVAKFLGLDYLDSGVYYRAVAYICIKNNIQLNEIKKIITETKNMSINFSRNQIILNGEEISKAIRSNEINDIVAEISAITEIRLLINDRIRNYCQNKRIVVDGRDIGTNVFPHANIKIYLDASVDTRARRRFNQNNEVGITSNYDEILNNIKKRDEVDFNRKFGALKIADDAHVIDTTNLNIEETINIVKEIVEGELK